MGTYYKKRNKEKKALSYFKKAVTLDASYTPAIYNYLLLNPPRQDASLTFKR